MKGLIFLVVVSYNTHGLSACITWDEPKERAEQISKRLNKYDLVFLQEDFCYNEELLKHVNHPYIARGRTTDNFFSSFGCCECGDGLLILSKYEIVKKEHISFDMCNGWIGSEHDCWADKGFLYLQIKVGEDIIDVYNVHMDAGNNYEDFESRGDAIGQLLAHVLSREPDRLIIAGDFNMKSDGFFLPALKRLLYLEEKNTDPDAIDHIFYRGLTAGRCDIIGFDDLSDHPATVIELSP